MIKIPPCKKYHNVYERSCYYCQQNGRALYERRTEKREKKQRYIAKQAEKIKNKILLDDTKVTGKQTSVTEGFIYAIENSAWKGWIKVGCSSNLDERLSTYQTGDPFKQYKIILSKPVKHRKDAEKEIHNLLRKVDKNGEWFHTSKDYLANLFRLVENN
jgi:hypothetical protein